MKSEQIRKLVLAGLCLALCLLLPFLTGQIPQIGKALSPMHIPVLICGFICGPVYGAVIGFIAPLLRFLLFQMPPMPTGLSMAFELAAYGLLSGLFWHFMPKKPGFLYAALILAMLGGRVVWGIASLIILGIQGSGFTFSAFLAGGFTNAVPGIICHILIIPPIVLALRKAGFVQRD